MWMRFTEGAELMRRAGMSDAAGSLDLTRGSLPERTRHGISLPGQESSKPKWKDCLFDHGQ